MRVSCFPRRLAERFVLRAIVAMGCLAGWHGHVLGFEGAWETGFGLPDGCNGPVSTAVAHGGALYVGGRFSVCGHATARSVARFDPTTRSWSSLGSGSSTLGGSVAAIAVQGSRVFVSGVLSIDGYPTGERVAEFDPGARRWVLPGNDPGNDLLCGGSCIEAMIASPQGLFVGGSFSGVGFTPLYNVARFDLSANRWFGLGEGGAVGVAGRVRALAIDGGKLLVAGYFERAGGLDARNLALYDLASGQWSALGGGDVVGVNRGIAAVAMDGDAIYIGGTFRLPGSSAVSSLARFDRSASAWSGLDLPPATGVISRVNALLVADGVLSATGICSSGSSPAFACTVRVEPGALTASLVGDDGPLQRSDVNRTIAVVADTTYVGGEFASLHGASANGIVALPSGSVQWQAVGNGVGLGLDRPASAAVWDGEDLLVGGEFRRAGPVDARGIARFSARERRWQSMGVGSENGVAGIVRSIAVRGRTTFIGGELRDADGMPGTPVRRFEPSAGRWEAVDAPTGPSLRGTVWQILVQPDGLLVGGDLTIGANQFRTIVARWIESTQEWTSISPVATQPGNVAKSLLTLDGVLYAAGQFPPGVFAPSPTVLRFDEASSSWVLIGLPSFPQPFGRTLQVVDGAIWLGGGFGSTGLGAPAVIVSLSGPANTWVPVANAVSGPPSTDVVKAITVAAGQVVVAGEFHSFAGVPATHIVRRDAGAWRALGAGIDALGRVEAMDANRSRIVVAGAFGSAGESVASNLAIHDLDPGFRDGFEASVPAPCCR